MNNVAAASSGPTSMTIATATQQSPYTHGVAHPQQQPPTGIDPNIYRQPTLNHVRPSSTNTSPVNNDNSASNLPLSSSAASATFAPTKGTSGSASQVAGSIGGGMAGGNAGGNAGSGAAMGTVGLVRARGSNGRSRKSDTVPVFHRNALSSLSQIYSAVYSGVQVYEMMSRSVAVMRRRHDSYLNATQILKVAGIDKGRRTKILEKEILNGDHEKVQGGYGKYQGTCGGVVRHLSRFELIDPFFVLHLQAVCLYFATEGLLNLSIFISYPQIMPLWMIPFERGVQLAQQYGVEGLLEPLLNFTADECQSPQRDQMATSHAKDAAPTGNRRGSISNQGSRKGNNSAQLSQDNPADSNSLKRRRFLQGQSVDEDPSIPFDSSISQTDMPSINPTHSTPLQQYVQPSTAVSSLNELMGPTTTASTCSSPVPNFGIFCAAPAAEVNNMDYDYQTSLSSQQLLSQPHSLQLQQQPGDSLQSQQQNNSDISPAQSAAETAMRHRSSLLALFMIDGRPATYPTILYPGISLPPNFDIDILLDDMGHSAMHFAAVLAQIEVLQLILNKGASIFLRNRFGETALMRCSKA
ncbi:hypothetical protein BSLG_007819 [Batrachochytrium salamandrivorans]|nr:hypothetical protein BSLG_007819 [Batrachochytrium salamandrivorans]